VKVPATGSPKCSLLAQIIEQKYYATEELAMAKATLEQRVAILETQLEQLKATVEAADLNQDWRSTVGMFTDDEEMKRLFADAMRLREADRA
jgi:hypothetical protein